MVSYPGSHFCTPFAKYAAAFFRQLAPPLLALRSQARSPRVSADSLRSSSSPLGGGMIPAVPAHPAHHSSGPADHSLHSHRRDRPAPSPAISRTTRNPEPIRAPRPRHSPILSRHQNTMSPLSEKNHSLHTHFHGDAYTDGQLHRDHHRQKRRQERNGALQEARSAPVVPLRCLVFLGQWWKEYCFER